MGGWLDTGRARRLLGAASSIGPSACVDPGCVVSPVRGDAVFPGTPTGTNAERPAGIVRSREAGSEGPDRWRPFHAADEAPLSISVASPWRLHIRPISALQDEPHRTHAAHGDFSNMNGRTFARILLAIVLIGGAIGLGVTAYDAGVSAGLVQSGQAAMSPGLLTMVSPRTADPVKVRNGAL